MKQIKHTVPKLTKQFEQVLSPSPSIDLHAMLNEIASMPKYVLFRTLSAAKTGRDRQIQCNPFLMEKDEEHVKFREAFS